MRGTAWRAFLGSFMLLFLSYGSCYYGSRYASDSSSFDELAEEGVFVCGGSIEGWEWGGFGCALFLASVSVAAGGAIRWWREQEDDDAGIRTPVLGISGAAAADVGSIRSARSAAREEVTALPAANSSPEHSPLFAHFDERGMSPLERVLAEE